MPPAKTKQPRRDHRRALIRQIQLLAIRSDRGPLRLLWAVLYELLLRLGASYLRRGLPVTVYVKGSFGRGEQVFGLSDLGLVAVVGQDGDAPAPRAEIRERWRRLRRWAGPLRWLVTDVPIYEQRELPALASTCYRYALDEAEPRSLFFPPGRSIRLATLPGLWSTQDWRSVSGVERRPEVKVNDPDYRRLAAWRELQFWWRMAYRATVEPAAHWAPYLCVKLIAEPARILLWLEHGERHLRRVDVLARALEAFPEEGPALEQALELRRELHRVRIAPVASVLPGCVRLSARIVRLLANELDHRGTTRVALLGGPANALEGTSLPLCDWHALVRPSSELSFVLEPGRVDDPATLRRVLAHSVGPRWVTLSHDGIAFRPRPDATHAFRSIAFPGNDPVSSALAAGHDSAQFPDVPGWSARDTAARAVAEHRAWVRNDHPRSNDSERLRSRLEYLFSGARAALFHESVSADEPSLPVTFAATAQSLAERIPASRGLIEDAYENYSASLGDAGRVNPTILDTLLDLVRGLDCYAHRSTPLRPGEATAPGRARSTSPAAP